MNHEEAAIKCLAPIRGALTDEQYRNTLERIAIALQDRFDLGYRAAGGKITSTAP
jgi:hypothetical protein